MSVFSSLFWLATAERAAKTFAQVAAATIGASGAGLLEADWVAILSVSGMAAVASLLTSVASSAITGDGPSLAGEQLGYEPERALKESA